MPPNPQFTERTKINTQMPLGTSQAFLYKTNLKCSHPLPCQGSGWSFLSDLAVAPAPHPNDLWHLQILSVAPGASPALPSTLPTDSLFDGV